MKAIKFIAAPLGALLRLVELATIVVAALVITEVSVSLDQLRQPLVDAISESTGRNVKIDGELRLTVSAFPALLAKEIHLYNETGWQSEKIVSLDRARIEVALMPLLHGEFLVQELSANQAVINLEQDAKGNNNWTISKSHPETPATESKPMSDKQLEARRYFRERVYFNRIRLNNITLNYRDEVARINLTDQVDKLHVDMHERSRLEADLSGIINDIPYTFTANSDLLRNIPDNKPWKLDLQGEIGGNPLSLDANIQITDGIASGQLELQTSELDAGKLLEWLHITEGLDFKARQLHMTTDLKGGSLIEFVKQSSFDVTLSDGAWKLKNHVNEYFEDITFKKVSMSALPGQDLKLELFGKIGKNPVEYVQQTNPLAEFVSGLDRIRLAVAANFAGADIKLDGNISLPVSSKTLAMNLAVSGDRLDQWNGKMINDLPPYGPYSLTGNLSLTPGGFHVRNFKSKIASSDLSGNITIDMTGARPLWNLDLVSNQLQIDDFDVEGYSLIPGKEKGVNEQNDVTDEKAEKSAKEKEREFSKKFDQRLGETREIDHWDIDISVKSRNIHSGEDRLGDGRIVISARADSFDMAADLNTPGGRINSGMGLKLVDDGINGHLKLDMDKFDYGIMLRRNDPESDAGGLLSTRVDLRLGGKDFLRRFDRANGQFDFVLWPQNISAGDIDIWAVNIFQAVSGSVTSTDSKINCVVGLFDIEEGQLNEEFFAVDTTKVWLYGNIDINYPGESIELALIPRAKKPKIGGIQTPVHLKGNLNDNFSTDDLIVKKRDIVKSFFSIVFSPLHVPMRRIFGKKVPADASEVCGKLLDRSYLRSVKDKFKREETTTDWFGN